MAKIVEAVRHYTIIRLNNKILLFVIVVGFSQEAMNRVSQVLELGIILKM